MDANERNARLSAALHYYIQHQQELAEQYDGKVILLLDGKVVGVFDDEMEAYEEVQAKYPDRAVMIQRVSPDPDSFTQTYHSRVAFPSETAEA